MITAIQPSFSDQVESAHNLIKIRDESSLTLIKGELGGKRHNIKTAPGRRRNLS
jgi:hypothetical protein